MIGNNEFNQIKTLIYQVTGMVLRENRMEFVDRRVALRLKALNLTAVRDYLRFLQADRSGRELEELVNCLVIGETFFFRDYLQLKFLAETLLPLIATNAEQTGGIRALSAGCATGEEAYTLAMILDDMLTNHGVRDFDVHGVDINARFLERARLAQYSAYALREAPDLYRKKYFVKEAERFRVAESIHRRVSFERLNLFSSTQTRDLAQYDLIFLRNVLIYFDDDSGRQVIQNLFAQTRPGGFLLLGRVESITRASVSYDLVRFHDGFVYRKKEA